MSGEIQLILRLLPSSVIFKSRGIGCTTAGSMDRERDNKATSERKTVYIDENYMQIKPNCHGMLMQRDYDDVN